MTSKYKAQRAKFKQKHIRIRVRPQVAPLRISFAKDGRLNLFKLPSTPSDPSKAITDGLTRICTQTGFSFDELEVVHGTTVGTNALLQRRGARTALVTGQKARP